MSNKTTSMSPACRYDSMHDFLTSESGINEDRECFIHSLTESLPRAMREQLSLFVENFGIIDINQSEFYLSGNINNMPKFYKRPVVIIALKCDDFLVSKKYGTGYLSGHYHVQWVTTECHMDSTIDKLVESYFMCLHIKLKGYKVKSITMNKIFHKVDEEDAHRLLIKSKDIESWYERFNSVGPSLNLSNLKRDESMDIDEAREQYKDGAKYPF